MDHDEANWMKKITDVNFKLSLIVMGGRILFLYTSLLLEKD